MLNLRLIGPSIAAAAAVAFAAGAAQATVYDLNLTGVTGDTFVFTQDVPGAHLDRGLLSLSGLDAMNTLTVEQGDEIHATVSFDTPFTVPASVDLTSFVFLLSSADFPGGLTSVLGSTSFFLGGMLVKDGLGGGDTTGQLANGVAYFPPNNTAFTFDSFTSNFTIDVLSAPVALDNSTILYTLFTNVAVVGVPEPGTWAMMLLGFGGLGSVLRARRRFGAGLTAVART